MPAMTPRLPKELLADHLDYLAARGIPTHTATKRGLRSLTESETRAQFGFSVPSILFPYHGPDGKPVLRNGKPYARARLFHPPQAQTGFAASAEKKPKEFPKFIQPKSTRNHFYFDPARRDWLAICRDTKRRIVIAEGETRGIAGTEHGITCLALGGVYSWRDKKGIIPDFDLIDWRDREVWVAFDSDFHTNTEVRQAAHMLAYELKKRCALVFFVHVPTAPNGEKQGLDDWLKGCGAKAAKEFDALPHEKPTPRALIEALRTAKQHSNEKHRNISEAVLEDLKAGGKLYRVEGSAELYYFDNEERQLYELTTAEFRAYCNERFGLNGSESLWSYVFEDVRAHCIRKGKSTEVYRFARYQNRKLYIHAGGHLVRRLDGKVIEEINNGDDGVLFACDPQLAPIVPNFKYRGKPVRELLVDIINTPDRGRKDLQHCYVYSIFFESELHTKPILVFYGVKGSAKTSGARALKRGLFGPSANVDAGLADREDAFWSSVTNNYMVILDNADSFVRWLGDALAVIATGAKFNRRKLYETNTSVQYTPRCFPIVTTRNPSSFRRDDIADRLLLIEVERLTQFVPESELLRRLDERRADLWGELLTNLNAMVVRLQKKKQRKPLAFRLADWAGLVMHTIAPVLGIEDAEDKLRALEENKSDFALEDDPVAQALEHWVHEQPGHDFIASGELFEKVRANELRRGRLFPIESARHFGVRLKNLRPELQSRFVIEQRRAAHNVLLYRFCIKEERPPRTRASKRRRVKG